MNHPVSCKEAIAFLMDYLDGSMGQDVRTRLEEHLNDCSPCEDFLKSYRATPGLCRKALESKTPEAVKAKLRSLLDQLRAESEKK